MTTGSIDRRARRTRGALKEALCSLIAEKGYEAITVSDLCRKAKVGRSTFYGHFTGKDDLKRSGMEHLHRTLTAIQRRALSKPGEEAGEHMSFGPALFEHAREHRDHYRALAGGPGAIVALDRIHQIVAELVRRELPAATREGPPRDLTAQFITGAYMTVLTWWLDAGAEVPAERVEAACRHLALAGVPA